MEREIHIALPNAVDVSTTTNEGDTISFGVIDENAMAGVFGQYKEEHPTETQNITDHTAALPNDTLVSIYNTTWDDFADGSRVYRVTSSATDTMTLDRKIVTASPYGRYYAVRPEAVRFEVKGTTLYRSTAAVTAGANLGDFIEIENAPILAKNIVPSNELPFFTYTPGTSTRNSIVTIHFAIHRPETDETVNFHKEVQIRNVP
jgi:hypothetical protein